MYILTLQTWALGILNSVGVPEGVGCTVVAGVATLSKFFVVISPVSVWSVICFPKDVTVVPSQLYKSS